MATFWRDLGYWFAIFAGTTLPAVAAIGWIAKAHHWTGERCRRWTRESFALVAVGWWLVALWVRREETPLQPRFELVNPYVLLMLAAVWLAGGHYAAAWIAKRMARSARSDS